MVSLTCNKPVEGTYLPGFDQFASNMGFVIYGLFSFICVTVLINTLIAMMEETIDTIDDRADVEWKFARSRLYMEYIRDGELRTEEEEEKDGSRDVLSLQAVLYPFR